jgi:hypothetical protein
MENYDLTDANNAENSVSFVNTVEQYCADGMPDAGSAECEQLEAQAQEVRGIFVQLEAQAQEV